MSFETVCRVRWSATTTAGCNIRSTYVVVRIGLNCADACVQQPTCTWVSMESRKPLIHSTSTFEEISCQVPASLAPFLGYIALEFMHALRMLYDTAISRTLIGESLCELPTTLFGPVPATRIGTPMTTVRKNTLSGIKRSTYVLLGGWLDSSIIRMENGIRHRKISICKASYAL